MATIRLPERIWSDVHSHLFGKDGEHFAFLFAARTTSRGRPVLMVKGAYLVPDDAVSDAWHSMELSTDAVLHTINTAVKGNYSLIEAHNHQGSMPRFSQIDREELGDFVRYAHDSLPDRPYVATVWGNTTVYGEYFLADGRRGRVDSIVVVGEQLRQLVSRDDDQQEIDVVFDRQLPWFTPEGQRQLGRLCVGVVGCGGTGSQVIQHLVYLGCRTLVLVDDDIVDETNMNRLVTAMAADIGTPKTIVGRRLAKQVAPTADVLTVQKQLQSQEALDVLMGIDLLFGCVDNDGARLILNELSLAYEIPYIDLAVGIDVNKGQISTAGGRVTVVLPDGPCLYCMGEIDPDEAAYFLATRAEQDEQHERGYVTGMDAPAPAVVSLNGMIAATAVNEFSAIVSGARPANYYTDYDLLGVGRAIKSQWLSPIQFKRDPACVQCITAGSGDRAHLERFIQPNRTDNRISGFGAIRGRRQG